MKAKIIFIHGMFLNVKSWENWVGYFENAGYTAEAIPWPLHGNDPAEMRENLPPGLGRLSLGDLHSHYSSLLRVEPEPPVVIGHSLGGWLVQKLASSGLIRAGVGICPVAPNRMLALDWGFLRNSISITNPLREKYDARRCSSAVEDRINFGYALNEPGFGWTNAVVLEFLNRYS